MQKYYVDCIANTFSQYPVVRTTEKIIARNFKGVVFDEAEARAVKLAGILNSRPTRRAPDACPYCAGKGEFVNVIGKALRCNHCAGTGQRR